MTRTRQAKRGTSTVLQRSTQHARICGIAGLLHSDGKQSVTAHLFCMLTHRACLHCIADYWRLTSVHNTCDWKAFHLRRSWIRPTWGWKDGYPAWSRVFVEVIRYGQRHPQLSIWNLDGSWLETQALKLAHDWPPLTWPQYSSPISGSRKSSPVPSPCMEERIYITVVGRWKFYGWRSASQPAVMLMPPDLVNILGNISQLVLHLFSCRKCLLTEQNHFSCIIITPCVRAQQGSKVVEWLVCVCVG